jgi:hypothetical protein
MLLTYRSSGARFIIKVIPTTQKRCIRRTAQVRIRKISIGQQHAFRRGELIFALTLHEKSPIPIQRFYALNEYPAGREIPETASVRLDFLATYWPHNMLH